MNFFKLTVLFVFLFSLSSCLKEGESDFDKYAENRIAGEAFLSSIAEQAESTESGLLYEIIEEVDGEMPSIEDIVTYEFVAKDINNEIFLETEEEKFIEGYVDSFLFGISEGLQLMSVGSTYKFYIPYQLAYGSNKRIFSNYTLAPYSAVTFEIKLTAINRVKNEGIAFLETNKDAEGVVTTESGLQYKVTTQGTGENAKSSDNVTLHYHGTFLNETVFDSSVDRDSPISGYAYGFVPGFTEALTLMNPGSKYTFYIPYELAYGAAGSSSIPPYSLIIFEIELISIN